MALTTPSQRRLLPVRLTDIPLNVRAHAAQQATRTANPDERAHLLWAALNPSDQTYYVSEDALTMLKAWGAVAA